MKLAKMIDTDKVNMQQMESEVRESNGQELLPISSTQASQHLTAGPSSSTELGAWQSIGTDD
jgi:hypothetical protein